MCRLSYRTAQTRISTSRFLLLVVPKCFISKRSKQCKTADLCRKPVVTANAGTSLIEVARLMRTAYDRRIRKLGLTRAQWWVLTHLYRSNGVSQTELAETLEIEKPTLGRLLDRLQAKGWVRREHDASDRRVWRVHLTDEVGHFILTRGTRSMSALFDLLEQLDQASLQAQRKLTIPFLKETLGW